MITEIFYAISSAALIPTDIALLAALAIVCVMIGRNIRDAWERSRDAKKRRALDQEFERRPNASAAREVLNALESENPRDPALKALGSLAKALDDPALLEKKTQEYQIATKAYCDRPERLARIAPALGLMGTLIPLGPALVGLSQGDLDTLANGLVVAFSTTVVGLATAILAGFVAAARKRWARRDFALVTFALERAQDEDEAKK